MKNALILHGTDAKPGDNWFPWVKGELEKKDWNVWVPQLPRANKPNIKRYTKFLLENKNWEYNEKLNLVGHSSGAVAILGLLEALPENIKVGTCVLVAAFTDDLGWASLSELFGEPFNFEKIKNKARQIVLLQSDNDPYVPMKHALFLKEKLDAKLIVMSGQGHFSISTTEGKYKKFPEILEILGEK